jgi:hypothetical protein
MSTTIFIGYRHLLLFCVYFCLFSFQLLYWSSSSAMKKAFFLPYSVKTLRTYNATSLYNVLNTESYVCNVRCILSLCIFEIEQNLFGWRDRLPWLRQRQSAKLLDHNCKLAQMIAEAFSRNKSLKLYILGQIAVAILCTAVCSQGEHWLYRLQFTK